MQSIKPASTRSVYTTLTRNSTVFPSLAKSAISACKYIQKSDSLIFHDTTAYHSIVNGHTVSAGPIFTRVRTMTKAWKSPRRPATSRRSNTADTSTMSAPRCPNPRSPPASWTRNARLRIPRRHLMPQLLLPPQLSLRPQLLQLSLRPRLHPLIRPFLRSQLFLLPLPSLRPQLPPLPLATKLQSKVGLYLWR